MVTHLGMHVQPSEVALDSEGFPVELPAVNRSMGLTLAALKLGCPQQSSRALQDGELLLR